MSDQKARALGLASSIEVKPVPVWRMQQLDGTYCMEWTHQECINPEKEARAYYADLVARFPNHAESYSIQSVEVLSDHDRACNAAADMLRELAAPQGGPGYPVGSSDPACVGIKCALGRHKKTHSVEPPPDPGMPFEHDLKIDPERLAEVARGDKTHEIRVFDRKYQVGHGLRLRGYDRTHGDYTGQVVSAVVTCVTAPGTYGLPSDIGVMSIRLLRAAPASVELAQREPAN